MPKTSTQKAVRKADKAMSLFSRAADAVRASSVLLRAEAERLTLIAEEATDAAALAHAEADANDEILANLNALVR